MEPSRLKAAAVASYFRSAITGSKKASSDLEKAPEQPGGVTAVDVTPRESVSVDGVGGGMSILDDGVDEPSAAQHGQLDDGAAAGDDGTRVNSDRSTLSTSNMREPGGNDVCSSEQHNAPEDDATDSRNYEVTYEHASEDEDDDEDELCATSCHHHHSNNLSSTDCEKKMQLQFIDVLLQADSHGLGLNIQVAERNPLACSREASSLVVASFRRLHPRDVGPAEAMRQIQVGDLLHSIDGEVVRDLQHLHSTLQQKRARSGNNDASFLLLRFLRPTSCANESDSASTPSLTTEEEEEQHIETKPSSSSNTSPRKLLALGTMSDAWLENKNQVAMLVRELATKNQELQEELVSSKLKLAEQSIQLEQLYALYAKTQLDNLPAFAISKSLRPFARQGSVFLTREKNSIVSPLGVMRKSAASASSKLHCEIEFAVQAEQERLRKHYQLQMDIEKRQIAARHQQELQALNKTMAKKLNMLEVGFREALKQQQEKRVSNNIETCSCGTWMRLQQELYIHQSLDHNDALESAECLVCNLLTDARKTSAPCPNGPVNESSSSSRKMQRVLEVLREYDLLKQQRTQYPEADDLGDAVKLIELGRDDPLQP